MRPFAPAATAAISGAAAVFVAVEAATLCNQPSAGVFHAAVLEISILAMQVVGDGRYCEAGITPLAPGLGRR